LIREFEAQQAELKKACDHQCENERQRVYLQGRIDSLSEAGNRVMEALNELLERESK
jgi:hypothetical protein